MGEEEILLLQFRPGCATLKAGRAGTLRPFTTDSRPSWNTEKSSLSLPLLSNCRAGKIITSPHTSMSWATLCQPWLFGPCVCSAKDFFLQSVCTTPGTLRSLDALATQKPIRIIIVPKACQDSCWGCVEEAQLCNVSVFKCYDLKFPFRAY